MCGEIRSYRVKIAATHEQSSCPDLVKCVLWKNFKSGSKMFWQKRYCQGKKQHECVRMQMQSLGQEVPVNLLPNGSYLE